MTEQTEPRTLTDWRGNPYSIDTTIYATCTHHGGADE